MAQLDRVRVFVQDDKGNYYRICSVTNPADHKSEPYLKIMFPDLKGVPLIAGHHNKGAITPAPSLAGGVQEFSYHYRSGVSHFKDTNGHVDQKKNMPTLIGNPALFLVRYTIRSLDIFKEQPLSKVGTDDFVIPDVFDGTPRAFEFAVSRVSGPWNVINEQGDDPVSTYSIPLTDPNVSFRIADCIWRRPPMGKLDTLFEIYTHDDPAEVFTFKPLK